MKRICTLMLLGAVGLLLVALACDSGTNNDDDDTWDYDAALGIDSIVTSGDLDSHDSVLVHYSYPLGCNRFSSLDCAIMNDSVPVTLMWNYYYYGAPCAHGPGQESRYLVIDFPSTGEYWLYYVQPDAIEVGVQVLVK